MKKLPLLTCLLLTCAFLGCQKEDKPAPGVRYAKYTTGEVTINTAMSGTGRPAIVFIPGLLEYGAGAAGVGQKAWPSIHEDLAGLSTLFTYDPAGTGGSPGRNDAFDYNDRILHLRETLRKADVPPPYVLVGHSIGGWIARLYAHRFPDEVRGLVLVDATSEYQDEVHGQRLFGSDRETIATVAALARQHFKGYDQAIGALKGAPYLGNLPLAVIASDQTPCAELPGLSDAGCRTWNAIHDSLQTVQKGLSGQLRLFSKPAGSNHHVFRQQPAAVREGIQSVLQ